MAQVSTKYSHFTSKQHFNVIKTIIQGIGT